MLSDSASDPKRLETLPRRRYGWKSPVEWLKASPETLRRSELPESQGQAPDFVGKKISQYVLLEILGGDGSGTLCRAEDIKLKRQVAVKLLPEKLAADTGAVQRFEHEARMASALEHPNICSVYELAESDGQAFIVMPLLEGETLRRRIDATG